VFLNETVRNTVGGAFFIANLNDAGATIFENCTFYNNFGVSGGSIRFEEGGVLLAITNHFSGD